MANTPIAAQNTNVERPLDVNTIVRFLIQADGDPDATQFKLKAQKNGAGGYVDVPAQAPKFSDDFNRADGVPGGSYSTGGSGAVAIVSNRLRFSGSSGQNSLAEVTAVGNMAHGYVKFTVVDYDNPATELFVNFRNNETNQQVYALFLNGNCEIGQQVGGSFSQVASETFTLNDGAVVEVFFTGPRVYVVVDGALVASGFSLSLQAATGSVNIGVTRSGASYQIDLDDLEIGTPDWPYLVAVGAEAAGTGNISPAWPSGHQAGDIGLLLVECNGNQNANLGTAAGFAAVSNSPSVQGANTRLTAYWCRATGSSQSAPTVTDPGDHAYGVILVFRNCKTTGDPWNITGANQQGSATTSISVSGVTTTVPNTMVLACSARANDQAGDQIVDWTNANLAQMAELFGGGTTQGGGGGIGVAGGVKVAAGATGASTATGPSATYAHMMIALEPSTNGLLIAPSDNIAASGADETVQRLTGGTGTFTAGRVADDINQLPSIDIGEDGNTELAWCLRIQSPAEAGDYWDLRVYAGDTPLDAYDQTARITVAGGGGEVEAAGAITLGPIEVDGQVALTIEGAGGITLGAIGVSGAGTVGRDAQGAITLGPIVVAGAGSAGKSGDADIELGAIAVAAAAVVGREATAAIQLGGVEVAAAGDVARDGTGDITLGGIEVAGAATVGRDATADITLGSIKVAGSGTGQALYSAEGDITLGGIEVAAAGQVGRLAAGAVTLGPIGVAGAATVGREAEASITLGAVSIAGAAVVGRVATAAITLGPVAVAGAATTESMELGTGSVTLGAVTVSGAAVVGRATAGAISLGGIQVAGAVDTGRIGVGAITLGGIRIQGLGDGATLGSLQHMIHMDRSMIDPWRKGMRVWPS
jgi:hypothetical protein